MYSSTMEEEGGCVHSLHMCLSLKPSLSLGDYKTKWTHPRKDRDRCGSPIRSVQYSSNTQAFLLTRLRGELCRAREKKAYLSLFTIVLFLGQGFAYIVQIGLKLVILLPLSFKCEMTGIPYFTWPLLCFLTYPEKILPKWYKPGSGNLQLPGSSLVQKQTHSDEKPFQTVIKVMYPSCHRQGPFSRPLLPQPALCFWRGREPTQAVEDTQEENHVSTQPRIEKE